MVSVLLRKIKMAISKTKTFTYINQEVTFENAYVVIDDIEGNKNEMQIHVKILVSAGGLLIKRLRYSFEPNHNLPLFNQAYNFLKLLPEFIDSQDC